MLIDRVVPEESHIVAERVTKRFTAALGREPVGVFAAPGRVNLIGEHVDYNDGRCLPMALPHATYAAIAPRADECVNITSLQQPEPWHGRLDGLGPGDVDGWAAYVTGVAWAMREAGFALPGFDVMVDGCVPLGAGLSSSAALECAVALALCSIAGVSVSVQVRHSLVDICMRAETEVAGAPTGGMDQTVSLLAEDGHALLLDCADWSTRQVPWDPRQHGLDLLVVDTRASHALIDGGYASRREDCEQAAHRLGVRSLREIHDATTGSADAVTEALDRLDDPRLRRRARHVLSEMSRVDHAVAALGADDLSAVARLLDQSHASLRDDYEVSCAELDTVVDTTREHGALGARMTGGGFGGSAIALVPHDMAEEVAEAVTAAFARRGWAAPGVLVAPPSAGARRIR